jgi:hypothetical protein
MQVHTAALGIEVIYMLLRCNRLGNSTYVGSYSLNPNKPLRTDAEAQSTHWK